ncbi:hypothetical protein D3C71_157430 [compost metagenome]
MTDDINEALQSLAALDASLKPHVGTSTSDAAILLAEQALSAAIPVAFKMFLTEFGWGGPRGTEIYGLSDVLSEGEHPSLVEANLTARKHGCPAKLLVFASAGDGGYYAMLDSSLEDESIIVWYPGGTSEIDDLEVSDGSFGGWLLRNVQDAIDLQDL